MDNEEARFLLGACQPSGKDADGPEIAAALTQAQHDPELAAWLACERRSDSAIAKKLRELEPDPALRARLLAGGRASLRARHWRTWRARFAIAAAVALTTGLGWWGHAWIFSPARHAASAEIASLRTWQRNAVGVFSNPLFRLDREARAYEPLEKFLLARDTHVAGELPFSDAIGSAVGCKVLEWRGGMISLTCFRSDTGELVHLFVGARNDVDTSELQRGPHRAQVGAFATVTWLRGDLVVMVASKLPAEELERTLVKNRLARATSGRDSRPS
jgi:hypothetical protein